MRRPPTAFSASRSAGAEQHPHPIFADAATRRALALAVDRETLARSAFGREAKAPPGPMSQLLWIWSDSIETLPFDTARANRALDAAGWRAAAPPARRDSEAVARWLSTSWCRRPAPFAASSRSRFRHVAGSRGGGDGDGGGLPGVSGAAGNGQFDSYLGAWLDEPSPRSLADQWTRAGWTRSTTATTPIPRSTRCSPGLGGHTTGRRRRFYREAMDTLNADVPALFLYAPVNLAVVSRRMEEWRSTRTAGRAGSGGGARSGRASAAAR